MSPGESPKSLLASFVGKPTNIPSNNKYQQVQFLKKLHRLTLNHDKSKHELLQHCRLLGLELLRFQKIPSPWGCSEKKCWVSHMGPFFVRVFGRKSTWKLQLCQGYCTQIWYLSKMFCRISQTSPSEPPETAGFFPEFSRPREIARMGPLQKSSRQNFHRTVDKFYKHLTPWCLEGSKCLSVLVWTVDQWKLQQTFPEGKSWKIAIFFEMQSQAFKLKLMGHPRTNCNPAFLKCDVSKKVSWAVIHYRASFLQGDLRKECLWMVLDLGIKALCSHRSKVLCFSLGMPAIESIDVLVAWVLLQL